MNTSSWMALRLAVSTFVLVTIQVQFFNCIFLVLKEYVLAEAEVFKKSFHSENRVESLD